MPRNSRNFIHNESANLEKNLRTGPSSSHFRTGAALPSPRSCSTCSSEIADTTASKSINAAARIGSLPSWSAFSTASTTSSAILLRIFLRVGEAHLRRNSSQPQRSSSGRSSSPPPQLSSSYSLRRPTKASLTVATTTVNTA